MGVYLLIIASVDLYYRGTYIIHSVTWTTSALCQAAGVLATLSSEASVFMLTAITADRVTTLLFPFHSDFLFRSQLFRFNFSRLSPFLLIFTASAGLLTTLLFARISALV